MGPLAGIKIVEFGGMGSAPFCAQMLTDMGAQSIRIERKDGPAVRLGAPKYNILFRGRKAIYIDFKKAEGIKIALKLIEKADATIEGFRPGAMERLGLGPEACLQHNPKLVYGRLTGWGQDGPLCQVAGHDINYLALSGGLHAIGRKGGQPIPPLNIIADYAGGGLMLAFGIVCALMERHHSGRGQVVDAAMIDGCAALFGSFYGWWQAGVWQNQRGVNILDTGAHFYNTYETADGKYIALGSLEPAFYKQMLELVGIDDPDFKEQMDSHRWPELKEKLAAVIKKKTRQQWCDIMQDADACFAPVLSFDEAIAYSHNKARKTFIEIDGVMQPAPAPRFSISQPEVKEPPTEPGVHTRQALLEWGFGNEEIDALKASEVI
jgi:alpha-methylacyl-CoA racemase